MAWGVSVGAGGDGRNRADPDRAGLPPSRPDDDQGRVVGRASGRQEFPQDRVGKGFGVRGRGPGVSRRGP
jgi:hypothetical protein